MNHFDVLGVPQSSTQAEITAAYRRLAKSVHPDAHGSASPQQRKAHEIAMARLNLAYEMARRQAENGVESERVHRPPPPFAATPPGACDICGAPKARHYAVEVQSAWIASALPSAPDLELCFDCARALGVAPRDARHTGAPRWRRGRRLAAAALFAAAIAAGALAVLSSSEPQLAVGSCVYWNGSYVAVPCGTTHTGRVVAVAPSPADCPSGTSFMRHSARVLCIDTAQ